MGKLSETEIQTRLGQLQGWTLPETGQPVRIAKSYKQPGFLAGLAFTTKVAVLAEKANHHPDVLLTFPSVTITLTTHDAGGLTEKDFDLAAKIDAL
jgi:4a-hydroxytetrahydrobiopterin dehydratase